MLRSKASLRGAKIVMLCRPTASSKGEKVITLPDSEGTQTGDSVDLHENTSIAPLDQSSSFPEAAQAFVEAIRRNRAYQKFLRKKLTEMCASCSFPCGRDIQYAVCGFSCLGSWKKKRMRRLKRKRRKMRQQSK
ncbi:hypothetical protein F2Q68_00001445 [Brassica cretica]|uniref:60S ribosomal protein L41 n=1 Tax=Brassica cretica TaxID=69181 RepID=A0A8S9J9F1_BRACR|nr:hypothetical protein F2Q68_00001445 [Brassica cretica]